MLKQGIKEEVITLLTTGLDEMSPEVSLENEELVMVTEEKQQKLCILVEEAKEQGVIDSACSRTVAGVGWIKKFIVKLEEADVKDIKMEKSGIKFQFGGGEKRKSAMKIELSCMI